MQSSLYIVVFLAMLSPSLCNRRPPCESYVSTNSFSAQLYGYGNTTTNGSRTSSFFTLFNVYPGVNGSLFGHDVVYTDTTTNYNNKTTAYEYNYLQCVSHSTKPKAFEYIWLKGYTTSNGLLNFTGNFTKTFTGSVTLNCTSYCFAYSSGASNVDSTCSSPLSYPSKLQIKFKYLLTPVSHSKSNSVCSSSSLYNDMETECTYISKTAYSSDVVSMKTLFEVKIRNDTSTTNILPHILVAPTTQSFSYFSKQHQAYNYCGNSCVSVSM